METIEIEVSKTVIEKKEIALPVFRKNGTAAYKVFSKDKCLNVETHELVGPHIQVAHAGLAWHLDGNQDCTEEEFTALFDKAVEMLNGLVHANEVTA